MKQIKKPYALWEDLNGKTGTFHVGKDVHEGIETKVVIFVSDDIHYVLAEYQKRVSVAPDTRKEG
ncbi:MAG: hypothetical protein KA968_08120 [Chitinophagaceae bacterium]|jgi:hypothetical protein|nr:hypothetical protein [Chitinophagaceae bacterium]